MKLSIDQLKEHGAFTGRPEKKEITWEKDGETYTFDVYVRRLSYHTAVSDVRSLQTDGEVAARRIAHCIVDEKGAPIFEVKDITGYNADGSPVMVKDEETGEMVERGALDSDLTTLLLMAISEVNRLGKTSPPRPNI